MAGLIKVLPLFIMVMPGMMARIKYPGNQTLSTQVRSQPSVSEFAFVLSFIYFCIFYVGSHVSKTHLKHINPLLNNTILKLFQKI